MLLVCFLFCRGAAEKAPGVPRGQGEAEVPRQQVSLSPVMWVLVPCLLIAFYSPLRHSPLLASTLTTLGPHGDS